MAFNKWSINCPPGTTFNVNFIYVNSVLVLIMVNAFTVFETYSEPIFTDISTLMRYVSAISFYEILKTIRSTLKRIEMCIIENKQNSNSMSLKLDIAFCSLVYDMLGMYGV